MILRAAFSPRKVSWINVCVVIGLDQSADTHEIVREMEKMMVTKTTMAQRTFLTGLDVSANQEFEEIVREMVSMEMTVTTTK